MFALQLLWQRGMPKVADCRTVIVVLGYADCLSLSLSHFSET